MKAHKYSAKRTECSVGHLHPSKAEAKRCGELHLLERAGVISGLDTEPTFFFEVDGKVVKHPNGRRVCYTPDWEYIDTDGQQVVEECKGFRTPDYVLRLAFFKAFYPHIQHKETGR